MGATFRMTKQAAFLFVVLFGLLAFHASCEDAATTEDAKTIVLEDLATQLKSIVQKSGLKSPEEIRKLLEVEVGIKELTEVQLDTLVTALSSELGSSDSSSNLDGDDDFAPLPGQVFNLQFATTTKFWSFLKTNEVTLLAFNLTFEQAIELEKFAKARDHVQVIHVHCNSETEGVCLKYNSNNNTYIVHRFSYHTSVVSLEAAKRRTQSLRSSQTPLISSALELLAAKAAPKSQKNDSNTGEDSAAAAAPAHSILTPAACPVTLIALINQETVAVTLVWKHFLSFLQTNYPPAASCVFFSYESKYAEELGVSQNTVVIATAHLFMPPVQYAVQIKDVKSLLQTYLERNLGPLSLISPRNLRDYFARRLPLGWVFVDPADQAMVQDVVDTVLPIAIERVSQKEARFVIVDGTKVASLNQRYGVTRLPAIVLQSTVGAHHFNMPESELFTHEAINRFIDRFINGEVVIGMFTSSQGVTPVFNDEELQSHLENPNDIVMLATYPTEMSDDSIGPLQQHWAGYVVLARALNGQQTQTGGVVRMLAYQQQQNKPQGEGDAVVNKPHNVLDKYMSKDQALVFIVSNKDTPLNLITGAGDDSRNNVRRAKQLVGLVDSWLKEPPFPQWQFILESAESDAVDSELNKAAEVPAQTHTHSEL